MQMLQKMWTHYAFGVHILCYSKNIHMLAWPHLVSKNIHIYILARSHLVSSRLKKCAWFYQISHHCCLYKVLGTLKTAGNHSFSFTFSPLCLILSTTECFFCNSANPSSIFSLRSSLFLISSILWLVRIVLHITCMCVSPYCLCACTCVWVGWWMRGCLPASLSFCLPVCQAVCLCACINVQYKGAILHFMSTKQMP